MPVLLTPSQDSAKKWVSLTNWPLRLDIAAILVAIVLLPFGVAAGFIQAWRNSFVWESDTTYKYIWDNLTYDNVSFIVFLNSIGPVLAIMIASGNAWRFTSRVLPPASTLTTSILTFLGWIYFAMEWAQTLGPSNSFHLRGSEVAIGVILEFGVALEFLINLIYLVTAAIAVHRLRKHLSSSSASPVPTEHELRSTRRSSPTSTFGQEEYGARVVPAEAV